MYKRRLYLDLITMPAETRSTTENVELKTLEEDLRTDLDFTSELRSQDLLFDAVADARAELEAHYSLIPSNAAVIEFGFSQHGLIVFCIVSSGIRSVQQRSMTFVDARRIVFGYLREIATPPSSSRSRHCCLMNNLCSYLKRYLKLPVSLHLPSSLKGPTQWSLQPSPSSQNLGPRKLVQENHC